MISSSPCGVFRGGSFQVWDATTFVAFSIDDSLSGEWAQF
jgi:hypothetical protein